MRGLSDAEYHMLRTWVPGDHMLLEEEAVCESLLEQGLLYTVPNEVGGVNYIRNLERCERALRIEDFRRKHASSA